MIVIEEREADWSILSFAGTSALDCVIRTLRQTTTSFGFMTIFVMEKTLKLNICYFFETFFLIFPTSLP